MIALRRRVPVVLMGATLALAGVALAACGGDDDEPGSDEDYVKAVCEALASFNDRRAELTAGAATADPDQVVEDFAELIRDLGDGLDDASPPEDAREAHDSVVDTLANAADAIEEGGIAALFDLELPTVQLPPGVRDRLQLAFNTSPDCSGMTSIFS